MKFDQLRNFVTVVDSGSINKAAETLFITQPSLSRSIQSLEDEMGKELLTRTNHGVSMTPTGRILYYYAQSILTELSTLERLKELDEDTIYSKLSVSVDSIFLKDDLVLQCYEKLQTKETEIQIVETTAEGVFDDVYSSKSELGITVLNSLQLQIFKKMADIKGLQLRILGTGSLYIHMNENNQLANQDTISFPELTNSTYIRLPSDFFSDLNRSIIIDGIQIANFPNVLIMSNYHAILNIAKNTNSFLIGHKWQIEELKHSKIKSMLLENSKLDKCFVIVSKKNEILSRAAEIFIDIINDTYACV